MEQRGLHARADPVRLLPLVLTVFFQQDARNGLGIVLARLLRCPVCPRRSNQQQRSGLHDLLDNVIEFGIHTRRRQGGIATTANTRGCGDGTRLRGTARSGRNGCK